jgi:hypothetical protein
VTRKMPAPEKPRWVSGRALARELGVDPKAIYTHEKRGVISRSKDGLFEAGAARYAIANGVRASGKTAQAIVAAASQPAPAPPAVAPSMLTYQTARAEREAEEALTARLKRQQLERKLIDRDGTIAAVFTAFRTLRDAAMPIGRRVAARAATMTDARDIQQLIDDEMRMVFRSFSEKTLAAVATKLAGQPTPQPDTATAEAA